MRPRRPRFSPALAAFACILLASCATAPGRFRPRIGSAGEGLPGLPEPRAEHVILVTIDALGAADRETLESLPGFSRLMREGSFSFDSSSVWPSLTNVAHASLQTGLPPAATGLGHNAPFTFDDPLGARRRYGYRRQLLARTIFDEARRSGYTTAAVLFPLTGDAPISWNFPEVLTPKGGGDTILAAVFAGEPFYLLELELRFGRIHRGTSQPEFDDFIAASAAWTFLAKKPGLLATHWVELDSAKHGFGPGAQAVEEAIAREDRRLCELLDAVEASGLMDRTAIIVQGDHSQFAVERLVRLNVLLEEAGLIRRDGRGLEWDAWVQSAGGSAILRAKNPAVEEEALKLIRRAAADPAFGIDRIMDRAELDALGAEGGVRWAVEGRPGTEFLEGLDVPALETVSAGGTHGYRPDWPGYRTVFLARGPGIQAGRELRDMSIMDVAPIVADLLGFSLQKTEALPAGARAGKVPEGLFAE